MLPPIVLYDRSCLESQPLDGDTPVLRIGPSEPVEAGLS